MGTSAIIRLIPFYDSITGLVLQHLFKRIERCYFFQLEPQAIVCYNKPRDSPGKGCLLSPGLMHVGCEKMKFMMNLGAWNGVFAVPCRVVDEDLRLAGSAQLKVLLWLLRNAGQPCETADIAKALGLSNPDVCDAMQYWVAAGLIAPHDETLQPAEEEIKHPQGEQEMPAPQPPPQAAPARVPARPKQLDASEVAARINASDEVRFMIDSAESVFGRPLSTPEIGSLVNLHDWDGLPADVIVMAVQYAAGIGRCNMRYIEKMALGWIGEGIDTHEKAEEKIRALDERKTAWNRVCRLFGIENRPPSATEGEAAERWLIQWGFGEEMLREAYDRCVDSTGKLKISYINRILERWNAQGVTTLEQARKETNKKKSATAGQKRATSYDIEAFEKLALYDGDR